MKKYLQNNKIIIPALIAVIVVLFAIGILTAPKKAEAPEETASVGSEEPTYPSSYRIENVEVITQDDLKAGCETYACTMLLKILGFDVDEHTIADNYLDCHYVFEDEDGYKYGPDMHSGFAGTAYAGWGVYAPSMAKSMNSYLDDQKSELNATAYEGIPLEKLCEDYICHGVPVMIWATTDMQEPYVFDTWEVNYVDENAKTEIGDTVPWYAHEHCLVLIGYDEKNYYFADSAAGKISVFEKSLVAKRYEQLFTQCIVVE